jgi:hypothetical protein
MAFLTNKRTDLGATDEVFSALCGVQAYSWCSPAILHVHSGSPASQ